MPVEGATEANVDVAVVGCGFAGVGAVCAIRRASASTRVALLSWGDGAAGLSPGVLDGHWSTAPDQPLSDSMVAGLSADEQLVLQKLGFDTAVTPMCVATTAGVLRPVLARDPAVLNLSRIDAGTVAVADLGRPGWDAEWLARACSESPWATRRQLRFRARRVKLDGAWWRERSDYDLAVALDDPEPAEQLSRALKQASTEPGAGWLFGPYLGLRVDVAAALANSLGVRVGETTSLPGGVAGARWLLRRDALLDELDVLKHRVRVATVAPLSEGGDPNRWVLQGEQGAGRVFTLQARAVVLASGGMVGGGVQLRRSGRGLLIEPSIAGAPPASFTAREGTPAASAFGPELVRLGAAGLTRAGVIPGSTEGTGLFPAGDVIVGADGALAAVRSGIAAGQAALDYVASLG